MGTISIFAANIALLRNQRKLSQAHMAELHGFKRSTWSTWEQGVCTPDYDTLVRLAGFFHISIDRLLRQDLRSLSQFHLGQLLRGHDKLTYIDRKLDPVK